MPSDGEPAHASGDSFSRPPAEIRSDAERDLDRLLYTLYFRRLSGITQVASLSAADKNGYGLVHNRLTHSLKVGQVARRMAQYLKGRPMHEYDGVDAGIIQDIDPDVAEFAGLAHDIGHPPFGHLGDEVLQALAERHNLEDGFEGNAQSFRVLTTLARRRPARPSGDDFEPDQVTSLPLSDRALASTVKYPFARGKGSKEKNDANKFGYIAPDERRFKKSVLPLLLDGGKPTLEAQIMDWSDDITYATHDIEDFGANGRIPLALLRHDGELHPNSVDEVEDFRSYAAAKLAKKSDIDFSASFKHFRRLMTGLPARIVPGSTDTASSLGRITSRIITQATDKTTVDSRGSLDIDKTWVGTVEILKLLTWFYVIDSPDLVRIQRGQKKRLEEVANELVSWAINVNNETDSNESIILQRRLPQHLGELVVMYVKANNGRGLYEGNKNGAVVRAVIDFVASMTEEEVDQYYRDMCQ